MTGDVLLLALFSLLVLALRIDQAGKLIITRQISAD
jgi:hypothetical protein